MPSPLSLSIGQAAELACLLEVTAPKPGNVHRGADFEDVSFIDFAASAVAIGPAMQRAQELGVGNAVLQAVRATKQVAGSNTNLGMILLLAPLAAVPKQVELQTGLSQILRGLTPGDSAAVYEAIRLANPGGLNQAEEMDVHSAPPADLLAAMRAAADRDTIARQFVEDFSLVFSAANELATARRRWSLTESIIYVHVQLMRDYPDTLIARKCGQETAIQAAHWAGKVLQAGDPGNPEYFRALNDLDFWLRSDHHRRNPGTTADLIAAALFVCLREGQITGPFA